MEKTGTSALQRFFSRNRSVLPMFGVHYPRLGANGSSKAHKHSDLGAALEHHRRTGEAHPIHGQPEEVLEKYLKNARARRATILSTESLSVPDAVAAGLFVPHADQFDIRVVIYVRRQDEWGLSTYRERVVDRKTNEARSFGDWLADPKTAAMMDYAAILENWRKVIGKDAIRVLRYPYETPLLPAFLNAAGLSRALLALPFHSKRVKESVSGDVLLQRLAENGGVAEPITFDQDARDALMNQYRVCNRQICQIYRPELSRLFGRN